MTSKEKLLEYRIVKIYSGFFCHWYYVLQRKYQWRFLFSEYQQWKKVAGNKLQETVPSEWKDLNITDRLTVEIGDKLPNKIVKIVRV